MEMGNAKVTTYSTREATTVHFAHSTEPLSWFQYVCMRAELSYSPKYMQHCNTEDFKRKLSRGYTIRILLEPSDHLKML